MTACLLWEGGAEKIKRGTNLGEKNINKQVSLILETKPEDFLLKVEEPRNVKSVVQQDTWRFTTGTVRCLTIDCLTLGGDVVNVIQEGTPRKKVSMAQKLL
jgi:hypothetical protein